MTYMSSWFLPSWWRRSLHELGREFRDVFLKLIDGPLLGVLGRDALTKLTQALSNTISLFRHLEQQYSIKFPLIQCHPPSLPWSMCCQNHCCSILKTRLLIILTVCKTYTTPNEEYFSKLTASALLFLASLRSLTFSSKWAILLSFPDTLFRKKRTSIYYLPAISTLQYAIRILLCQIDLVTVGDMRGLLKMINWQTCSAVCPRSILVSPAPLSSVPSPLSSLTHSFLCPQPGLGHSPPSAGVLPGYHGMTKAHSRWVWVCACVCVRERERERERRGEFIM